MIRKLIVRYKSLLLYLSSSVLSMIVDTIVGMGILFLSGHEISIVTANTIGCIAGFLIGWLLDTKLAFSTRYTGWGFVVYLLTFIGSVALGNYLISVVYEYVIKHVSDALAYLIAKGVSITLPFFFWYGLRKWLFRKIDEYEAAKAARERGEKL